MKTISVILASLILLSGCSLFNSDAFVEVLDENGKVIGKITDIALARDYAYMNRGSTRDKYTKEMYKESGIITEWETKEYKNKDGEIFLVTHLPKKQTVRPEHRWQQLIETRPPDHRGWKSFDNIVDKAFAAFGFWLIADTFNKATDSPTYKYEGDYLIDSNNPISTYNYAPIE